MIRQAVTLFLITLASVASQGQSVTIESLDSYFAGIPVHKLKIYFVLIGYTRGPNREHGDDE